MGVSGARDGGREEGREGGGVGVFSQAGDLG